MKSFAVARGRERPARSAVRPAGAYVHHPMGPTLRAQRAEIRRILRSTGAQAKLAIGEPNDSYEQEADHVADQVMAMSDADVAQRQLANEDEEETLQTKPLADRITPLVQRQEAPPEEEEEETVQAKSRSGTAPAVTPNLESKIAGLKGGGQPLEPATRAFFEPRFGRDFGHVRIHADGAAAETAKSINASAFTLGNHIALGAGEYRPNSRSGQRLLGHELTHVVQQGQSSARARANTAFRPLPSSFDLQKGPPVTEAGRFAQRQAGEDLTYLRTEVVAALRATSDPIRVNTADAIDAGLISLGIITRHPEPERHASDAVSGGTYFFPDTDLNTVFQSSVGTGGAARVPGAPANRIYVLVRRHYSFPRRGASSYFSTIVHEAQHYLDHHTDEVRARGIDREVFDLWLSYKTEFNAYWAEGRFDSYPVTAAGMTPSGLRMLRWQAIRDFLMSTAPYRARYRWLWIPTPPPAPTGTGETRRIAGWRHRIHPRFHRWFRSQVDGYHEPAAFNRLNSPRIEQFYQALESGSAGRAVRVRAALALLSVGDIAEIRASDRFERLVRGRLRGPVLREVVGRIGF